MRFRDLPGLTSLPVDHVRHRFRNEEVITVLPVRSAAGRDSLLVATPFKLAVVTSHAVVAEHWMTYWAPWDSVRIVDDAAAEPGMHSLTVSVGSLSFYTLLAGPQAKAALGEFVGAVEAQRSAVAST